MTLDDFYRIVDSELARAGNSQAGAIMGKCIDCVYDPEAGGSMRTQVYYCGCTDCPLYAHRPGVQPVDGAIAKPARKQDCPGCNKTMQRKVDLVNSLVGKGTLRAAIDACCIDCTFDAAEPGNWREQVSNCHIRDCPLWSHRAKSSKAA